MAAVVSALDSHTPLQYGENAHVEHGWSNDVQEKILQLTFQLVRTKSESTVKKLGNTYRSLVQTCYNAEKDGVVHLSILYRIMLHTRDLVGGKGEYALFYELLTQWVSMSLLHPNAEFRTSCSALARAAIKSLVQLQEHDHGYGSWKDMKYILNKLKERFPTNYEKCDAFNYIIHLMTTQLQADSQHDGRPTLLGRWSPRESSKKFGWISRYLAEALHPDWMSTASTAEKRRSASRKCLTHYRQLLAALNKRLRTPQVAMCAEKWGVIDFDKDVTSITMARQKRAFEYVDKKGNSRGDNSDRITCRSNYKGYIGRCTSGKTDIKAARVSIVDMVKEAISLSVKGRAAVKTQIDAVNEQWKVSGKQIGNIGNFVCVVDTSGSMECDGGNPLHAAIGLGMRAAEKSVLGNRVMTFSAHPKWLNLEGQGDFVSKVAYLKSDGSWGCNTNFQAALQLVADACVEKQVPPSQVADLVLAIFSDMQIDVADSSARTMHEQVKKMFHDAGMRSHFKTPYDPPHVLYWNLRSTNGFPSMSTERNTSMLSGFSPVLLNSFCEKGMEVLANYTPWALLLDQIDHERYAWSIDAVQSSLGLEAGGLTPVESLANIHEPPEMVGEVTPTAVKSSGGWFGLW